MKDRSAELHLATGDWKWTSASWAPWQPIAWQMAILKSLKKCLEKYVHAVPCVWRRRWRTERRRDLWHCKDCKLSVIGSKLGEVLGIARGYGFKFDVRQACTRKLFFLLVEYCLLDGLLLDQSRCSAECRMHQESATKHASIIKMYK